MRAGLAKAGIVGAVVAGFCAFILAEYRIDRGLREDLAALRRKSREAAELGRENADMAKAVQRMAVSRAGRTGPPVGAPAAKVPAPVVLDPGFIPAAEWKNNGALTARDAAESCVWAMDRGDIPSLARMLSLSDQSRARIAAVFAGLTEADRAKYATPEQMFALIYAYANPVYFAGMQVTAESPGNANGEIVTMQLQYGTGQIRQRAIPLTLSPEGWKRSVADDEVASALETGLSPPKGANDF